jgi:hypothetical protein
MSKKYRVAFKEIIEYAPLEIEARSEKKAIKAYEHYYYKGLIGRSLSPSLQQSVQLVRDEVKVNPIPPMIRNAEGLMKPIE